MTRRRRIAWALALGALLAGAGAWIVLHDRQGASTVAPPRHPTVRGGDVAMRAFEAAARSERRQRRRRARAEHPAGEPGPTPRTMRLYSETQAQAEPVARRFHAAFARYELGESVAVALRATVTADFARQLLSAPPRAPRAGGDRAPVRLGRLELVPIAGDRAGSGLGAVELVGTVRRGGRREPIAFELERRRGEWRVAGLGL